MPAALFDDADGLGGGSCRLGKVPAARLGSIAATRVGGSVSSAQAYMASAAISGVIMRSRRPGGHAGLQNLAGDGSGIVAAVPGRIAGAGVAVLPATGTGGATAAAERRRLKTPATAS